MDVCSRWIAVDGLYLMCHYYGMPCHLDAYILYCMPEINDQKASYVRLQL